MQTHVRLASAADVDNAVAVGAGRPAPSWGEASIAKRQTVMFAFRELLNSPQGELAAILTSEHGKVLSDAARRDRPRPRGRRVRLRLPHLIKGAILGERLDRRRRLLPQAAARRRRASSARSTSRRWCRCGSSRSRSRPATPSILKPSEKDPSAANWMAELLTEAGLPDGVFNVVHGDKEAVDALLTHPDVASISFVGSTPIARYVYETGTGHGKRVQALGGAKNHMLVLPDADLDLVADSAVNAGFGSAGERCMADLGRARGRLGRRRADREDHRSGWRR